jgi:hypothetical protein
MKTIHGNQRQTLFAYLAGIIDGEGTITIHKTKIKESWNYSYAPAIRIGLVNQEVVKLFADTFSLKVRQEKQRGVPNRQLMFRAETSGTHKVIKIINKVYPYLIIKKKQADVIYELCKKFNSRKHDKKVKCVVCNEIKKQHGRQLCMACYMRMKRNNRLDEFIIYKHGNDRLSVQELQRREELYLKIKEFNAVGVAATTNQE